MLIEKRPKALKQERTEETVHSTKQVKDLRSVASLSCYLAKALSKLAFHNYNKIQNVFTFPETFITIVVILKVQNFHISSYHISYNNVLLTFVYIAVA